MVVPGAGHVFWPFVPGVPEELPAGVAEDDVAEAVELVGPAGGAEPPDPPEPDPPELPEPVEPDEAKFCTDCRSP